nr:hypothetical protein Iba_scaffold285408CG0010 [Ipomoea batatas]
MDYALRQPIANLSTHEQQPSKPHEAQEWQPPTLHGSLPTRCHEEQQQTYPAAYHPKMSTETAPT